MVFPLSHQGCYQSRNSDGSSGSHSGGAQAVSLEVSQGMSEVVVGLVVRIVIVPATAAIVTPTSIIHVAHAVAPTSGNAMTVTAMTHADVVHIGVVHDDIHVRVVIAATMMTIMRTVITSVSIA